MFKRNHKVFDKVKYPMKLQIFADPETGAGAEGEGGGGEAGSNSFDDFLKDKDHQAEFDRRINKAVNTAVTNAQEKWKALTDDKLSEAERLAKMNKDEKAQYLQQKKEKELAEKEAAITKRELMAEAKNTLTEKKLPIGLAEILTYTDAESCNKSIASVEKAFQEAVQAAVEERLKGSDPMKRAPGNNDTDLEKQIEKLMRGQF